jgi:hypothetical protein
VIVGSLVLILVAVVLLVLGLMNGSSAMLTGSIGASLLAAVALVVGARQDTAARAGEGYLDDEPVDRVRGDEDDHFASSTEPVAESYAVSGARAGRSGQRAGFGGGAVAPPAPPAEPAQSPDFPTVTLPAQPTPPTRQAPPDGPREAHRKAPADPPARTPVDPAAGPAAGSSAGSSAGSVGADDEFDEEDPPDEPAPQVVFPADAARVARLSVDVLVIDGRPRYHLPGCVHLLGRESEPLPVSEAVELEFTPCSLCEPASALLTDPRRA